MDLIARLEQPSHDTPTHKSRTPSDKNFPHPPLSYYDYSLIAVRVPPVQALHGTTSIESRDTAPEPAFAPKRPAWRGTRSVVIITPVRNRRDITLQCLRSLERIDSTGLLLQRIVVDDGSMDGTSDAVREYFPDAEVISGSGDLWCSGAVNVGIEHTLAKAPDYILIINDDTVFDSCFLQQMVATAEANPKSVIGALLLLWDEPHRVFQVAPRWETWYGGWRHKFEQTVWTVPEEPFEVELIAGNCTLFPAAAFHEAGLFATRWLPHFGDAEFTPRLKKRGWRLLIEPRARVFNQPNEVPPKLSKMRLRELYDVMWRRYNHPHNFRNRFMMYWLGAPTKAQGAAGFAMYVVRLALQAIGIRSTPPAERPLRGEYN
ncbi:MAG: glycosyltransferase family 2 protein [Pyrinomonadaceae bacterium]